MLYQEFTDLLGFEINYDFYKNTLEVMYNNTNLDKTCFADLVREGCKEYLKIKSIDLKEAQLKKFLGVLPKQYKIQYLNYLDTGSVIFASEKIENLIDEDALNKMLIDFVFEKLCDLIESDDVTLIKLKRVFDFEFDYSTGLKIKEFIRNIEYKTNQI